MQEPGSESSASLAVRSLRMASTVGSSDETAVSIRVPFSSAARLPLGGGSRAALRHRSRRRGFSCAAAEVLCGFSVALATFSSVFTGVLFLVGWNPEVITGRRASTYGRPEPQTLVSPADNETEPRPTPFSRQLHANNSNRPAGEAAEPTLMSLLNAALRQRRLYELRSNSGFGDYV